MPKSILDKITGGREYRRVETISVRSGGEDEQIVEGYATTFNSTYTLYSFDDYEVLEQIDPHAFDDCDMSDVIMQYNHEGRVFARISNGTLETSPDSAGLHVWANLGGTEIGRQLYEEISGGYTTKMSFGFVVGEDSRTITEDHEHNKTTVLRTITKISKLYDVSAVSIPANDATEISARCIGEGVIAEIREELATAEKIKDQRARIRVLANY